MDYRNLGKTGVVVSRYCLGAMMFGTMGNSDHDDCVRIIHRAFDAGINFIDTADAYSRGESEAIVAKAKTWQEKDDRVQIIDPKARSSEGPRGQYVLTSAYIGYLLPMMVELQHLHVDLA